MNRRRLIWIMVLAAGVCTWSAHLALQRHISGIELSIFRDINNLSDGLRWPFLIITQFGSAWALLAVAACLTYKHRDKRALEFLLAGSASFVVVEVLKHLVKRARPDYLLPHVHVRELFVSGYGFPSGHTAMATVLSLLLLPYLPRQWRWLPVAWISLVALSRLYLGVHAPLDIIGGLAVGCFMWAGVRLSEKSSLFRRAKNHKSHA